MIKKGLIIISILTLSGVITAYLLFYFSLGQSKIINKKQLKNGDLVLRKGRSLESYAVYTADEEAEFTHIGIVVIENNDPKVIHAVPHKYNYILKVSIDEFLSPVKASEYAIYRSSFSKEKLKHVTQKVQEYYNSKIEFDNHYSLKTDDKMYCTELILKAFTSAGINLKTKTKEISFLIGSHAILFPSEFTKLPFQKIKMN